MTVTRDNYDPDAAPERSPFSNEAQLIRSVRVTNSQEAYAIDQRTGDRYAKMTVKNGDTDMWILQSLVLDAEFEDGSPIYNTDFIFLLDPRGNPLPKDALPGLIAAQFLSFGVSASYAKVGQPNSAVGRCFTFQEWTKPRKRGPQPQYPDTRHWPVAIHPVGYVFTGEKRIVTRRQADDDGGVEVDYGSPLMHNNVGDMLRDALVGHTPAEMFDIINESASLKQVGYFSGVGLLEAADDGSLVKVLQDQGILVVRGGKFEVPDSRWT